jgi:flagellar assembly protein FliH
MDAVIRRPTVSADLLVLRTGLASAAVAVPAAAEAVPQGTQGTQVDRSTSAPSASGPAGQRLIDEGSDPRPSWQAEVEQAMQEAAEAGRISGHEAGRAEWADRIDRLDAMLSSLRARLAEGLANQDDLLVELAFEATVRILGQAAPTREGVQAVVREALVSLRDREQVVLLVAPGDLDIVRSMGVDLARLAGSKGVEIVADDRVEWGGCLIETASGGLDARLETQVQRLRDLMLAARATGNPA